MNIDAINQVFEQARSRFNFEAASGINTCFQFSIPDSGDYYLIVNGDVCELKVGITKNPGVTLSMDIETLISILNGQLDSFQAFTFGRIGVNGDIKLAAQLMKIFNV